MTPSLIETVARALEEKMISFEMGPPTPQEAIALARAALQSIEASGTHLVVERRLADEPIKAGATTLTPIPRPIVKVLRKEAEDAMNGTMVVDGVDVDMAELLEDAASEIERLRALLAATPSATATDKGGR